MVFSIIVHNCILFYDGITFVIWFENVEQQKIIFFWKFGILASKWPLCSPKFFSWSSSSLFVPESKTSIRRSIGCQMAEIQANHVAKLPTDLPAERSWVPPSARGASVVSPLGLLCAITIGEIGSKLSCFLISLPEHGPLSRRLSNKFFVLLTYLQLFLPQHQCCRFVDLLPKSMDFFIVFSDWAWR